MYAGRTLRIEVAGVVPLNPHGCMRFVHVLRAGADANAGARRLSDELPEELIRHLTSYYYRGRSSPIRDEIDAGNRQCFTRRRAHSPCPSARELCDAFSPRSAMMHGRPVCRHCAANILHQSASTNHRNMGVDKVSYSLDSVEASRAGAGRTRT